MFVSPSLVAISPFATGDTGKGPLGRSTHNSHCSICREWHRRYCGTVNRVALVVILCQSFKVTAAVNSPSSSSSPTSFLPSSLRALLLSDFSPSAAAAAASPTAAAIGHGDGRRRCGAAAASLAAQPASVSASLTLSGVVGWIFP